MFRSRILCCLAAGSSGVAGKGVPKPPPADKGPASAESDSTQPDVKPTDETDPSSVSEPTSSQTATTSLNDAPAPTASTSSEARGDLEEQQSSGEGAIMEGEVPVRRWIQKPKDYRKVDENGEYIVSTVKWHTGELAYKTPEPPGHLEPRFGYQVVSVKKPTTWWQHYRKYPRWSFAHVHIHVVFGLGVTYLCAFMMDEIRRIDQESKTPYGMVGDQLGRGDPMKKDRKIAFSAEETEEMLAQAQDVFMSGKETEFAMGSKDYKMKKIPRPKEFSMDDSLMSLGVPQPKFTAGAQPNRGTTKDMVRDHTNLNV